MAISILSTGPIFWNKLKGRGARFSVGICTGSASPAVVSVQDCNLGPHPVTVFVHPTDNAFQPSPGPIAGPSAGVILDIQFSGDIGSTGGISFMIAQEGMTQALPVT